MPKQTTTSDAGSGHIEKQIPGKTGKSKARKPIGEFIINDYGHLVHITAGGIRPWSKVVSKGIVLNPVRMCKSIDEILLPNSRSQIAYNSCDPDLDWRWEDDLQRW